MTTWNFDKIISDWTGGYISGNNITYKGDMRMCVNTSNLKNGNKNYCVFLHKKNNKKNRLDETFIERSKFNSDEDQIKKREEIKLKYLKRIAIIKNQYRYVIYKGYECIEMKLNKGKSVLIEKLDLDKIKNYCWCLSSNNKYAISNIKEIGQNQYLQKILYPNVIEIIKFKDGNSLNCLRSNLLNSGKTKTIVTPEIIEFNKKVTKDYLSYLKRQRVKQRELYTHDDRFKFDKIVSKWYMSYYNLKIRIKENQIQFLVPFEHKYRIIDRIEFDKNNKKYKIEEAKKLKKVLLEKYDINVNNPYRYVIFNGTNCIEMKLVGKCSNPFPISVIFDIKHLDWIKDYKWRPSKTGQMWRAVDTITKKYMHRLIVDEIWKKVDHIDGYEINNLESNLRDGTENNMLNQRLNSRNKTGINGIHWDISQNRYRFKWYIDNKEYETQFPAGMWGSVENAFCAAIAFKVKKDDELGNTNGIRI